MPVTLEDLTHRMGALEREVARLRQLVEPRTDDETPAQRGAQLLREAKANQAALSVGVAKAFAAMGVTDAPIGAENLQKILTARGMDPKDNSFSREIIAMREE